MIPVWDRRQWAPPSKAWVSQWYYVICIAIAIYTRVVCQRVLHMYIRVLENFSAVSCDTASMLQVKEHWSSV
jgi:hypothetical protein